MTSVGIGLLFVLYTDSLFGDWRELIGVRLEIFRRHDVVDVVDAVDVVDVHVQMNTVFESGADPTDHPPQTDRRTAHSYSRIHKRTNFTASNLLLLTRPLPS